MKAVIPIIIVHTGDSFYLKPVLRQARKFNPESSIYLISDESTNHYDFVEHINIAEYYSLAEQFKQVYVHMSINPYHYELFCFLRWFVVLDFVAKHNLEHFLCLDSDVMLYCNVDEVFSKWMDYDMTICHSEGPQYTLFKRESLEKFCDYILSHYTDREKFKEVQEWHKHNGISDMRFITRFSQQTNIHAFDLIQVVDGACFDHHMKIPQGFEMHRGLKRIYWREGLPYGKEISSGEYVRFNALHFQGGVKHKLNQYLYRDLPFVQRCRKNLLWLTNPKRLKSRFYELKKILSNKEMFVYFIRMRVLSRIKK